MPQDTNLLMQGYGSADLMAPTLFKLPTQPMVRRVNGTGSHWYPSREEMPRSGPTPQFLAPWMFDDNIERQAPGVSGLGFDRNTYRPDDHAPGIMPWMPWPSNFTPRFR